MHISHEDQIAISYAIARISPDDMVKALCAIQAVAANEDLASGDWDHINKVASAIVEPIGYTEAYWTDVEDDYAGWVDSVYRLTESADWKAVAQHVADNGY